MPEKNFIMQGVSREFGLSTNQEQEFVPRMKTVVAKIFNMEMVFRGSGVFLSPRDLLTVAHVVKRKGENFWVHNYRVDGTQIQVQMRVKRIRFNLDLAVLELLDNSIEDIDYAILEEDVDCPFVGESLYMISNPAGLTNIATKGYASYPSSNLPKHLGTERHHRLDITSNLLHSRNMISAMVQYRRIKDTLNRYSTNYMHPDVPVIQADWLHGDHGSSGGPIFNALGRIVGILCQSYGHSDLLIHHKQIREYIDVIDQQPDDEEGEDEDESDSEDSDDEDENYVDD